MLCFPKSLYLGVEEHIRDILNCHRVAKDCFIKVVYQWLSHEDGTVWSCKVNKMFMSLSLLTTGNSLHLHRLELMKVCIFVHTLSCILSSKVKISSKDCLLSSKFNFLSTLPCVVPLLLHHMLSSIERYHYTKPHILVSKCPKWTGSAICIHNTTHTHVQSRT